MNFLQLHFTIDLEEKVNFVNFYDFWTNNCPLGNINFSENYSTIAGENFFLIECRIIANSLINSIFNLQ
jgi:hypothetical protein